MRQECELSEHGLRVIFFGRSKKLYKNIKNYIPSHHKTRDINRWKDFKTISIDETQSSNTLKKDSKILNNPNNLNTTNKEWHRQKQKLRFAMTMPTAAKPNGMFATERNSKLPQSSKSAREAYARHQQTLQLESSPSIYVSYQFLISNCHTFCIHNRQNSEFR